MGAALSGTVSEAHLRELYTESIYRLNVRSTCDAFGVTQAELTEFRHWLINGKRSPRCPQTPASAMVGPNGRLRSGETPSGSTSPPAELVREVPAQVQNVGEEGEATTLFTTVAALTRHAETGQLKQHNNNGSSSKTQANSDSSDPISSKDGSEVTVQGCLPSTAPMTPSSDLHPTWQIQSISSSKANLPKEAASSKKPKKKSGKTPSPARSSRAKSPLSKLLPFRRSSSKERVNKMKLKTSREILQNALGNSLKNNLSFVKITADFIYRPNQNANLSYDYDPITKKEIFTSNCPREMLQKLDINMDKNGNGDASQFLKSLGKLSSKYEGTINLNGWKITTDKEPGRRLRINYVNIRSDPIIMQLSAKGVKTIDAQKSDTKCRLVGDSGTSQHPKWICFEGENAENIQIITPKAGNGYYKIFIIIPTTPWMARQIVDEVDLQVQDVPVDPAAAI